MYISQTKLNIRKFKLPGEDKTLVHFFGKSANTKTSSVPVFTINQVTKHQKTSCTCSIKINFLVPRFDRNNSVSLLEKIEQSSAVNSEYHFLCLGNYVG